MSPSSSTISSSGPSLSSPSSAVPIPPAFLAPSSSSFSTSSPPDDLLDDGHRRLARDAAYDRASASASPEEGSSDSSSGSSSPRPAVVRDSVGQAGPLSSSAGCSTSNGFLQPPKPRLQRQRTNPLLFVRHPPPPHAAPIPVRLRSSYIIHDPASPFHRRSIAPSVASAAAGPGQSGAGTTRSEGAGEVLTAPDRSAGRAGKPHR